MLILRKLFLNNFLDLEKQRHLSVCHVRLLRELSFTGHERLFVYALSGGAPAGGSLDVDECVDEGPVCGSLELVESCDNLSLNVCERLQLFAQLAC